MTTPTQPNNNRRWIILAISILISAVFLFLAFRGLKPEQFINSLSEINLAWLAFGALWYFVAVVIIAWRWQFLLRAIKLVPLMPLSQIVSIGYMGNNVYPFRAGEALRIFLLKRDHGLPVTQSVTTVVVERVFDGIVMLSFILIGLLFVDVQSEQIQTVANIATPIFVTAVIVFFTLARFPAMMDRLVTSIAKLLPTPIANLILKLNREVLVGLGSLRTTGHLLGAIFASYTTWAVEASVYWVVMWAFGMDFPYPAALLVVGTVNLAGLIPASPGQVGVYEFFVSSVLLGLGISQDRALAYAIVVHLVIWLPVTLVGFIFLIRRGMGWSSITHASELTT